MKVLSKLINIGVSEEQSLEAQKRVRIVNSVTLIGILIRVSMFVLGLSSGSIWLNLINTVFLGAILLPIIFNSKGKYEHSANLILLLVYVMIVMTSITFGSGFHNIYYLIPLSMLSIILKYNSEHYIKRWFFVFLAIAIFLYFQWHFENISPLTSLAPSVVKAVCLFNDMTVLICCIVLMTILLKQTERHLHDIKRGKDQLLVRTGKL